MMTEEKVRKLMIGLLNHIDEHKKGYKKWTNTEVVDMWMKVNNIGHVHELKPRRDKRYPYVPLRCDCGYEP
jgi:hypothetical protein